MKIAVVGSFELGSLNDLYDQLKKDEISRNISIDLVLIAGDFLAVRNVNDLKLVDSCSFVENLNDFNEYYSGKRKATHLTLVIGGHYEATNYFKTLPYGGFIADNIYFMGYSNVVKVNGVRIAGISGINDKIFDHIFKTEISKTGYFESLPFEKKEKRSICYTRYLDIYRMSQLEEGSLDILITFDWPLGILNKKSEIEECLRNVPFILENGNLFNDLGSDLYKKLLDRIKPKHYFAAKLNYKLDKIYRHSSTNDEGNEFQTHFHALKKFSPSKKYEIFEIESKTTKKTFEYDQEWLKILKLTNQFVSIEKKPSNQFPEFEDMLVDNIDAEKLVKKAFKNNFKIPINFSHSLPVKQILCCHYDKDPKRVKNYINKQTTKFCKSLAITDPNQLIIDQVKNDLKVSHKTEKVTNMQRAIQWTTGFFKSANNLN